MKIKHKTPEADLQKQCVYYLLVQYPFVLFHHSPNEGRRTPQYWNWLKALGTKPGFPDLIIFESRKGFNGLVIELKSGKGKLTDTQNNILNEFRIRDYVIGVVNNFEQFKSIIDDYFA